MELNMIEIDGSAGEGGGQVVRTALGLSLVTGRPFSIHNIRGRRRKPGLLRQHLTAVRAATIIGNAEVTGSELGSSALSFAPKAINPGTYTFSIGTAGSCTLVLQAILPALLLANESSKITIEGGTHNPMAPPFNFLQESYLPLLQKMGVKISATLERPGFYPAGGGRIVVKVEPVGKLLPIELAQRGELTISALTLCAQLPGHIGQRELNHIQRKLGVKEENTTQEQLKDFGPGNAVSIFVKSAQLTETFTGFGQINVKAEKVAAKAVKEAREYIKSECPVGPYLADQLLIPMAMAGSGRFRTGDLSNHTKTNMEIIKRFLDVDFSVEHLGGNSWELKVNS
jgi:RNA 3'-terminal phosphate cyclase (ATP)